MSGDRIGGTLLAVVAMLVVVCAQAAMAGPSATGVRADLRLGSMYNSNPLQYSKEDQDAFLNHNPTSRFAIRSVDDTYLRGDAGLSVTRKLMDAGATRLSYGYSWNSFARNPVKNAHTNRISIRQPLTQRAWIELGFLSTPRSYLRHLWDDDFQAPYQSYPHYQPAYVSTREIGATAGSRLSRRLSVTGALTRLRLDYNAAFDERDARGWQEEVELIWGQESGPTLTFSPSFMRKNAKATDPAHPGIADSLRADISSHEWELSLSGGIPAGSLRWLPVDMRVRATYMKRTFTSARPADLFHHGRMDRGAGVSIGIERQMTRRISLFASGRYEAQWTSGIIATGSLGEVASWRQLATGGGVRTSWSGRLPW